MWDAEKQASAENDYNRLVAGLDSAMAAWTAALSTGNQTQITVAETTVEEVLREWRKNIAVLREQAAVSMKSDDSGLTAMSQKVTDLMEQRALLAKLRSEHVTRDGQATSVNPKTVGSPYTNLLGLDRTFRPSVRQGIIIAAIVFGVIALGVLVYVVYAMVVTPAAERVAYGASTSGMVGGGGGRHR